MSRHPLLLTLSCLAVLALVAPARAQMPDGSTTVAVAPADPASSHPEGADQSAGTTADVASAQPPAAPPTEAAPAESPTPPADAASNSSDTSYELSSAELAELGLSASGGEASAVDTSVLLSGFIDFSVLGYVGDKNWRRSIQPQTSFFIGNLNVYLSKNITEDIRTFAEVRFLYLPNGTYDLTNGTYNPAIATDYNEILNNLHWGGVEIERVYLEWRMHRYLTLRAGQFLTPYGIWNVDHGSPTIISVSRPYPISLQFFPERQTGFELFGRVSVSAEHSLGYHLTLSNGLGQATEFRDLDGNKAVGGRLYWRYDGFGSLTFGLSGFYGRDTSAHLIRSLTNEGKLAYEMGVDSQSDILAFAGDLQWHYGPAVVQLEVVTQQRKFTERGRLGHSHPLIGQFIAPKDTFSHGGYLLLGYRFSWLGIMPYFLLSNQDYVEPYQFSLVNNTAIQAGLNIRPLDAVVVKLEYDHTMWPDGHLVSDAPIQSLAAQLAWAF